MGVISSMWSRSSRAGAHVELMEVAGRLQAPIVHATRGKECIEYDNPFDVGMTGLLGFVELEMKAAGFLDFATDLHNPDFAKMADAAGLLGLAAETPEQVQPMLGQALEHDGPALVEVVVNR